MPERNIGLHEEERRPRRSDRLCTGTLACGRCDAPVSPLAGPLSPAHPLSCPYCSHEAPLRDFLSLASPPRPTRVEVRLVRPASR
jgi:hypothetical protein